MLEDDGGSLFQEHTVSFVAWCFHRAGPSAWDPPQFPLRIVVHPLKHSTSQMSSAEGFLRTSRLAWQTSQKAPRAREPWKVSTGEGAVGKALA